jgi:hypothetical protein
MLSLSKPSGNCRRKVLLASGAVVLKLAVKSGNVTTVAGNGTSGFSGDNGLAIHASLNYVSGIALDRAGNLFIADRDNNRIRKVAADTGIITTVAGNGSLGFSGDNGSATAASLFSPYNVAVDQSGDLLIADYYNNRIRKVHLEQAPLPPPTISGTPITVIIVGDYYLFIPKSTNATSFSYTGLLPPGLTFEKTTGKISGTPTKSGIYSNIIIIATNSTGSVSLPAITITVNLGLSLDVIGAGSGSVNGNTNGDWVIACTYPPLSGTCLTSMPPGTDYNFHAIPGLDSIFGGWQGQCSKCSSTTCNFTPVDHANCTAVFLVMPPTKINETYYSGLDEAYKVANYNDEIQCKAVTFAGGILFSRGVDVMIKGGFNGGFKNQTGFTTLNGSVIIESGKLTIDSIVIR